MSCPDGAEKAATASPSDAVRHARSFSRPQRLTARREFVEVYDRGRRTSTPCFALFAVRNAFGHPRLGLTVSRKYGGAVERNRVKRRLREIFRLHREILTAAIDVVVNVRAPAASASFGQLEKEFLRAFSDLARKIER